MTSRILPLLYFSLSGEMCFILEQRLKNVEEGKSIRVLKDIIMAVLKKKHIEEIFKPKELPNRKSLRAIFENLAHSSIMRLNETSMDKLFDLMTMTVKYQILSVVMAEQVFTVTINHLIGIRNLLPKDEEVKEQIEHAYTMLYSAYGPCQAHEWHVHRIGMLDYFQGARVKVSLMLREKKQLDNGRFVVLPRDEPIVLPKDCNTPGRTSYFENDEETHSSNWPTGLEYTAVEYDKPDTLDSEEKSTLLGSNMYKEGASLQIKGGGGAHKMEDEKRGDELKLLENLFGSLTTAAKGAMDLSLFDDLDEEKKYVKETEKALGNYVKIDASQGRKTVSSAAQEMKIERAPSAKKNKSKGENMLDMMDEAAARPATAKGVKGSRAAVSREPSAGSRPGSKDRTTTTSNKGRPASRDRPSSKDGANAKVRERTPSASSVQRKGSAKR